MNGAVVLDKVAVGFIVVFRVAGGVVVAVLRELGRSLAAVWRVLRWHDASRRRREHFERYEGLLGPWRHSRDAAAGVQPPPRATRPPLLDIARAYALLMIGLVWVSLALRGSM